VAVSRAGSIENVAPSKSKTDQLCMIEGLDIPTCNASGSTPIILHPVSTSSVLPLVMTVTLSNVLEFFQVKNFPNASEEEAIFFYSLFFQLTTRAKSFPARCHCNCNHLLRFHLKQIPQIPNASLTGGRGIPKTSNYVEALVDLVLAIRR
jgi:hypothetical protein